uniref:Glutathione peroxidase n=1 Tax=Seriola dumerili TaxID=41447 RepID=A0A3B4U3V4_SERDU
IVLQFLLSCIVDIMLVKTNITCFDLCLYPQRCDSSTDGNIYKYQAKTLNGSRTVNFSEYAGKSVLIVNVATY